MHMEAGYQFPIEGNDVVYVTTCGAALVEKLDLLLVCPGGSCLFLFRPTLGAMGGLFGWVIFPILHCSPARIFFIVFVPLAFLRPVPFFVFFNPFYLACANLLSVAFSIICLDFSDTLPVVVSPSFFAFSVSSLPLLVS